MQKNERKDILERERQRKKEHAKKMRKKERTNMQEPCKRKKKTC